MTPQRSHSNLLMEDFPVKLSGDCIHTMLMNQALLRLSVGYRYLLKATIILVPVLGFTWIIGLFAVGEEGKVFAYLFVIANVVQVRDRQTLMMRELTMLNYKQSQLLICSTATPFYKPLAGFVHIPASCCEA